MEMIRIISNAIYTFSRVLSVALFKLAEKKTPEMLIITVSIRSNILVSVKVIKNCLRIRNTFIWMKLF
jgi:hypothetical protein